MSTNIKFLSKYFEEVLCATLLVLMITLVIINVFLRYVFSISISWAEEVATICFVWCVFVGASATYKHKMDMGIDILVTKAPKYAEKWLKLVTNFILLAINGYIFYMAMVFTKIAWIKPTAVLGISSAIFNLSLVVGFGLITGYTIKFIYRDIRNLSQKAEQL